nr:Ig-like domain-containing protein [Caldilineaceae bacterium]
MCYSDAPHFPTVRYICNQYRFTLLLDCNHDDYFHTNPPAESYLATHWNVADSEFLLADEDDHAALPELRMTTVNSAQTLQAGTELAVEVLLPETFSNGDYGYTVQRIDFFRADQLVASVSIAPYRYSWQAQEAGDHTLTARGYDQNGKATDLPPLTLTVTPAPAKTTTLTATLLPLVMN